MYALQITTCLSWRLSSECTIALLMNWNLSFPYLLLPSRIRVKERLSRDEPVQRPPDWSLDRQQTNRHCTQGNTAQYTSQRSEPTQQSTVPQPQPSPGHHPAHGQTAYPPSDPECQQSGPPVDSQPYLAINAPVATAKLSGPPEVQPRRRVSADQIHAAHREARMEARQTLKEEAHTEGLLKSRKAVLPSEIRRRERSVDDTHRGRHEDMDWQTYSPEWRRRSRDEEDWDREKPRERGRERNVERIRERGREHLSSHGSQEERVFRSLQPSHTSVHHQPRHHQPTEPVYYQDPQILQQEPPTQQQYESTKRQGAQIQQQDSQKQHQYDNSRQPQEPLRQQQSQYEPLKQEPPSQQPDSRRKPQEPQLDEDSEPQRHQQQQDPSGHQRFDSAVYLQKGPSLPQAKHKRMEISGGPKPKIRTRSMSDIGVSQHSAMYRMERAAASREPLRAVPPSGMANGDVGTLDTRVSVAQLRHSYLENANRKPELYVHWHGFCVASLNNCLTLHYNAVANK